MKPVPVARKVKARQVQRALLQYFKPENWFEVRNALEGAGRQDLIGDRPECLIPAHPPPGAREKAGRRPAERTREDRA
jgi:hypothetical protein